MLVQLFFKSRAMDLEQLRCWKEKIISNSTASLLILAYCICIELVFWQSNAT